LYKMTTLKQINDFIGSQPIAMVGVSRNPKKFGSVAFKELRQKGMNLIPVNANADEIMGEKTFPGIRSLPGDVKGLLIMTKKDQTAGLVREAREKGIRNIWIQQSSDSTEAINELKGTDINYITGQCILMHYKPNGVHKFHGSLKKFFGSFPK
ncbi:MAG TPA: CoA-binding protein, partial [Bacteroidales bacterium]|nr:CoA-binding protein [Bacteroidales bacterium]